MSVDFAKLVQLVCGTQSIFFKNRDDYGIVEKGLFNYVTQVDVEIQEYLRNGLRQLNPDIGLYSEEQDNSALQLDRPSWILDPVDGTTNLFHHYRQSAVSLALYDGGAITCGVIYNPFTDELFTAKAGEGAYLNGTRIRCTDVDSIGESLVSVGTTPYEKQEAPRNFALFQKIFLRCQDIRRSGSAALDIAYVAAGRTEAYFEKNLKPWDYAAGVVILREAGGMIGGWDGNEPTYEGMCDILATNGHLHSYFLKFLHEE